MIAERRFDFIHSLDACPRITRSAVVFVVIIDVDVAIANNIGAVTASFRRGRYNAIDDVFVIVDCPAARNTVNLNALDVVRHDAVFQQNGVEYFLRQFPCVHLFALIVLDLKFKHRILLQVIICARRELESVFGVLSAAQKDFATFCIERIVNALRKRHAHPCWAHDAVLLRLRCLRSVCPQPFAIETIRRHFLAACGRADFRGNEFEYRRPALAGDIFAGRYSDFNERATFFDALFLHCDRLLKLQIKCTIMPFFDTISAGFFSSR
nr:MAG TPA: hypothetical protein [Caudoviricetes sp.]